MKVFEALRKTEEMFKNNGVVDYKSDARFLMQYFLGCNSTEYILRQKDEVSESFFELVQKRISGIPVQYITESAEFMGLEFYVNENVLIPRQDTEILVERALDFLKDKKNPVVYDICTGSGCIAVSVSKMAKVKVAAVDISEKALSIAKINAERNMADVAFVADDILNTKIDFSGADLILSNPPYIRTKEIEKLDVTVKCAEPFIALDGGEDGLVFYRKISKIAFDSLNNGGAVMFETGFDQGADLTEILEAQGFKDVEIIKDYSGNDRVAVGIK
ncbi:MAG: peptide chain release factor N(5)-glutamine methyltransferase [Clostridia bacterium]|nr:peptide chain release factor N(5)-glutamine methyltransferase [Clostridia bacterium]